MDDCKLPNVIPLIWALKHSTKFYMIERKIEYLRLDMTEIMRLLLSCSSNRGV